MGLEIGMIKDPLHWQQWPIARAYLDPALSQSDEDWASVENDLNSNEMQLWAVLEGGEKKLLAAAVTRIAQTNSGEVAEIYLCGGANHRDWAVDLASTIASSSREIGCRSVRIFGRLGWKKILESLGFKPNLMIYELVL
tara:strand:- start:1935 stop:2351 length:417 start_codon:yes stop_codon:yes gene_type:complete